MKIILIGNYQPDRQESMERFAQMLYTGFLKSGFSTEIWRPVIFLGSFVRSTNTGLGKWLGYIDKWVIFPLHLRWRNNKLRKQEIRYHICDHSNAPYIGHLPVNRTGITCHDVLAIRGAFGYADAYCPASGTGKILQKWILNNLRRAALIAFVSQTTLNQFLELVQDNITDKKGWQVIHNAFNNDFSPLDSTTAGEILQKTELKQGTPFLLHVGSDLPRKNRLLLLDMVNNLGSHWQGHICFAGQAVDETLMTRAKLLGIEKRVVSITKPEHLTLVALYSTCDAFIFPSFSEGFGWPVIEAQACGAPVIASDIEPMPEVSGGTALHADPKKPAEFANAFLSLSNRITRNEIIQKGIKNSSRFNPGEMITSYLHLHGLTHNKS